VNVPLTGRAFPQVRHPQADVIEAYPRMGGVVDVRTDACGGGQYSCHLAITGLGLEMQGPVHGPGGVFQAALDQLRDQLWERGEEPRDWLKLLFAATYPQEEL
jgi:hypothetical protein